MGVRRPRASSRRLEAPSGWTPTWEDFAMANDSSNDLTRPVPLALAALAVVGWLLVAYFWSQASDLRSQMEDGLRRAEVARQGLAADLQNLQKAAGTAADLKKQADASQKALTEAVSARASAQID